MYKKILLFFIVSVVSFYFAFNVNLEAIKGSYVFVDGTYNSQLQYQNIILNLTGTHIIVVKKEGYTDFKINVNIAKDLSIISKQIPLATILIQMNLNNATISYTYNNKTYTYSIKNNSKLNVPCDLKKIKIESLNHNPKELSLELKPFSTQKILISLTKVEKSLIKTSTKDVEVFINDKYVGTTPIELEKNTENIILKKDGYVDYTIKKLIDSEYTITMKEGKKLSITSNINDAVVIINKVYAGTTPFSKTLPVGKYFVEIKKLGYGTKTYDVNLNNNLSLFSKLETKFRKITLLNTKNYEFSIDGKYIGAINEIITDNRPHLLKIKNKTQIFAILITKDFPEILDLNKIGILNIFSTKQEFAQVLDKTKKLPAQFLVNMISDRLSVNVKTEQKYYNILIDKGSYANIFTENTSGLFVSSNVKDISLYLNNEYIGNNTFLKTVNPGTYEVTAKHGNIIKKQQISIEKNKVYYISFNFKETVPVKIYSKHPIKINGLEIKKTPYYFYLNKGPNCIEINNKKAIIFIYGPQSINIDDLM